jgi:HPt (histidine-containing phosphotransfer) domain-containing protein
VTVDALDLADMRRRLGHDEELMAELFQMFLDDYAAQLTDVARAVEARDLDRVRQTAHRFKSSAGNVSAARAMAAAAALEISAERGEVDGFDRQLHGLVIAVGALVTDLQRLVSGG